MFVLQYCYLIESFSGSLGPIALLSHGCCVLFFFPSFSRPPVFQMTRRPTGFTRSPPEKNAVRTQSTRSSNWKRSFCLTCTCRGTAGTR